MNLNDILQAVTSNVPSNPKIPFEPPTTEAPQVSQASSTFTLVVVVFLQLNIE